MENPKFLQKNIEKFILVTLILAALSWIAAIVIIWIISRSLLHILLIVLAAAAGLFGLYKYLEQSSYERDINRLSLLLMGFGLILAAWTFYQIHFTWVWLIVCLLQVLPFLLIRQDKFYEDLLMDGYLAAIQTDADRVARATRATTMQDYASALGLSYIPDRSTTAGLRSHSQFASSLHCQYCHQPQHAREWPVNGDIQAMYFQKEPGRYSLKMTCAKCGKDWYVVWDQDPGQILPLS
ncbi:MAG: hypothetical protein ABIJ65_03590 [Chloroflexota bacterium]